MTLPQSLEKIFQMKLQERVKSRLRKRKGLGQKSGDTNEQKPTGEPTPNDSTDSYKTSDKEEDNQPIDFASNQRNTAGGDIITNDLDTDMGLADMSIRSVTMDMVVDGHISPQSRVRANTFTACSSRLDAVPEERSKVI